MNEINLQLNKQELKYLYNVLENNFALIDETTNDFDKSVFRSIQGQLISKLIGTCRLSHNDILNIRANRFCKTNQFDDNTLFMGGGLHSMNRASMMHKRLAYATMVLGGKQQNGGQGTEYNEILDKQDELEIKAVLRDIIAAFGYNPEDLKLKQDHIMDKTVTSFVLIDLTATKPRRISAFEMSQHEFTNCFDETILGHLARNPEIPDEPIKFDREDISLKELFQLEGEIGFVIGSLEDLMPTRRYAIIPGSKSNEHGSDLLTKLSRRIGNIQQQYPDSNIAALWLSPSNIRQLEATESFDPAVNTTIIKHWSTFNQLLVGYLFGTMVFESILVPDDQIAWALDGMRLELVGKEACIKL